jgi:hypothetical protein
MSCEFSNPYRYYEEPRRSVNIFKFDAAKNGLGATLAHFMYVRTEPVQGKASIYSLLDHLEQHIHIRNITAFTIDNTAGTPETFSLPKDWRAPLNPTLVLGILFRYVG